MDCAKVKIVVGTEIYFSDQFSNLWLRAAKVNLPPDVEVVVFDNNLEDRGESLAVQYKCLQQGCKYVRLLPNCHQNHAVELLRIHALNVGAEAYFHLDIDCPPLKGLYETMIAHLQPDVAIVTEKAGAHCFIARTMATVDMTCQRIPFREGEQRTIFSDCAVETNKKGLRFFDHCRWMFHEMTLRGGYVKVVDHDFVHATIASLKEPKSHRLMEAVKFPSLLTHVANVHDSFWGNAEIKELLCQK